MTGLVFELQKEALDHSKNVSQILMKALVVSRKLEIEDIQAWIKCEMNGYPFEGKAIPEYREIHGMPRAWNPVRGWIPIDFEDPVIHAQLSTRKVAQSTSELDQLVSSGSGGMLHMPYPPEVANWLAGEMRFRMQTAMVVPRTEIVGILNAVRNKVLDWALELESKGILGEGMSFSDNEKKLANSVTYSITNNIHNMQNSMLQQASPESRQTMNTEMNYQGISKFVQELSVELRKLNLRPDLNDEIEAEIRTVKAQLESPKPKKLIVEESLKSIKTILEGTTGNILASGLINQIGSLFT